MDVDWCLSCERRIDGLDATTGPYCSPECLSSAQPSSPSRTPAFHPAASDAYRIREWAQAIPPHVPAGAPTYPFADLPCTTITTTATTPTTPSVPSSPFEIRSPRPTFRQQPTPKLIERTAASTPLPTLAVSASAQVRPLHRPRATSRAFSQAKTNTTGTVSEASTSLTSLLSEPMVVTPDEDYSFGAGIGALVRSWVHGDRPPSRAAAEDCLLEKAQDYFSAVHPRAKNHPSHSSSKKAKKTLSPHPAPLLRNKSPVQKPSRTYERRSTPTTQTHTPTPVIFPSCRAVDVDWDEEDEEQEIVAAPRAQYHPAYRPKLVEDDVHWTRAPSPAASVSSTGSSILIMAPKRRDTGRSRLATGAA
ncbi:hypothetical protein ID866_3348 [Astraeus odoratus]|nr:hypothetical protein ID866_3348 [Astraeus odoratus]